jgi:hypothetical protein
MKQELVDNDIVTDIRIVPTGTIYKRSDSILIFILNKGVYTTTVDILKYDLEVFKSMQYGIKSPLICDIRGVKKLDQKSIKFIQSTIHEFATACAVIVESNAEVFLYNFISRFYKPAIPTKMFKNEIEALNWTKEMI